MKPGILARLRLTESATTSMRKPFHGFRLLLVIALIAGSLQLLRTHAPTGHDAAEVAAGATGTPARDAPAAARPEASDLPAFLPPEAARTIARIRRGGPFPHPQDGTTFGNYEGHLPRQPRGYYREYTVDTPGLSHRGARRIVTGGQPPRDWYYSDDHYASFRAFNVPESLP